MAWLHSNNPINKVWESLIPRTGLLRSAFNGLTDAAGGPLTEEGIKALGTEAERTAQRNKVKKLDINAQSLTDQEKAQMEFADYSRKYIEDNFGALEESQIGKEHFDQYRNAMIDKAHSQVLKSMTEAERAEYDALDDAAKSKFKDNIRQEFDSSLPQFQGSFAEQLNNVYNNHIDLYNQLYKKSHISDMTRLKSMFLDSDGNLSKGKAIGIAAGVYGASNIIGSGSLGIPFISTASWNR